MGSLERVKAALAGGVADRPPAGAWGHRFDLEWDSEKLAAATVDRARDLGWDFVKFQPRATFFSEAFGARWRPSGSATQSPVLVEAAVTDAQSWAKVRLVDRSVMDEQARALGLMVHQLCDQVPVIQTVFSPISVASYLTGRDRARLLADLREHPDLLLPALDRIAEALIDFSRRSIEAGAAGIFYAISGFTTRDVVPPDEYERLLLPGDRRILEALPEAAWFNVLHLCGPDIESSLGRQLPVQAISWSIHDEDNRSLAEVRDATSRAVMGGIDQRRLLVQGPEEAIRAQVKAAVDSTQGRGLLLAPGCSAPPEAPLAHLRAMMPAA